MTEEGDDAHDGHGHGHHHGHANDRGLAGLVRYLRHAPRMWRSVVNDAVVDLIAPAAGERVVDIGAGVGAGAVVVARRGATAVAVEPTPYMRGVLSARRAVQRARARIEVVDGAAEHIPLDDGAADAVMAVNTMHHWVDPDAAVAEIARVLAPGGRLVLVDEDFEDPTHPDHDAFARRQGHRHCHGDDHGHGDGEGHRHGFTMVDVAEMGERFGRAGLDGVEASMGTLAGRPVIRVTRGVEMP
jgi:SAM-dependent methyltransferase